METTTKSSHVQWVERNTGRKLTPEQQRCVDVLCTIARPYNLPLIGDGWQDLGKLRIPADEQDTDEPPVLRAVEMRGDFMVARMRTQLSTFDASELTRMVVAAHKLHVRVGISPELHSEVDEDGYLTEYNAKTKTWDETDEHPRYHSACLTVHLHARAAEGESTPSRHPGLDHLRSLE